MLTLRVLRLAVAAAALAWVAAAVAQTEEPALDDGYPPIEEGYLPVPVVTIYPGDAITDEMIEERPFPNAVRARQSVVEGRPPLIGKVARRTLQIGRPIPINAVAEPMLVTRGVPTQAIFRSGGIFITTIASPIRSGALGDYVQMRNIDSGKIIAGVVQADGTVLVGGGP